MIFDIKYTFGKLIMKNEKNRKISKSSKDIISIKKDFFNENNKLYT